MWGGGVWATRLSLVILFSFTTVQQTTSGIGHLKMEFLGLATNTLNVRNTNNGFLSPT